MKKYITRALLILGFIFANHVLDGGVFDLFMQVGPASAQVALTQTSLAAAVNGPSFYNGPQTSTDTQIFLTAVTGISAPALPGSPVSVIYVGREAMGVFTVNTSIKSVGVIRGYMGTLAAPHPNGQMVLISNVYATNVQYGANIVPSGFFNTDPPLGGACLPSGTPTTPWVNVLTGAQWTCNGLTTGTANTWIPSWGNPYSNGAAWSQSITVASAAGAITPSGPYFNISGTQAITGFNIPIGFDVTEGGCFTANPTGIWTWTAAGNIATAGTTTAATTPVTFCWNVASQKWIPSRLS
jgi:hypothetical protein